MQLKTLIVGGVFLLVAIVANSSSSFVVVNKTNSSLRQIAVY